MRELKNAGVDGVKLIYSDQSHTGRPPLPVMRADIMQAMIDEAHAQGLKALVHAPTLEHAKAALRAGADALVHSVSDAPVDDEFIALMRKNHATYTTTLSLYTSFSDVQAWMRRLQDTDVTASSRPTCTIVTAAATAPRPTTRSLARSLPRIWSTRSAMSDGCSTRAFRY